MKLPGFRKGKVPAQLVIQRIGREAVVEQALRDSLPEWYERALLESGVVTVGDPKLDVGDLPAEGEELEFTIEVGVRPTAELGEWRGLEVGKADVEVPDEAIEAELDRLREGVGEPEAGRAPRGARATPWSSTTWGRSTASRSTGSERRDFPIELGGEALLPEFDAGLTGASAGEERTVEVTLPRRPPARGAGRQDGELRASRSRRCARRTCPSSTTTSPPRRRSSRRSPSFATSCAGGSPRASSSAPRPSSARPPSTPSPRTPSSRSRTSSSTPGRTRCGSGSSASSRLSGIDPQAYAQMQGKDRHDLIDDAEEDAERSLRREAVLAAVADAEGIEVTDEDLLEAIGPGEGKNSPQKLLARLRESGRDGLLRDEVRMRKAAEAIAERRSRSRWSGPPPASRSGRPEKGEAEERRATRPRASPRPASSGPRARRDADRFYTLSRR